MHAKVMVVIDMMTIGNAMAMTGADIATGIGTAKGTATVIATGEIGTAIEETEEEIGS